MKKTFITFFSALLLAAAGLNAQSLKDGMDHLYADRYQSAIKVFDKLLAENPNNIEAIYWKGQTYFDMDENEMARELYQKAIQTNGRAPLLLVGLGHADLLDKKVNDARQKFEEALTASKDRKGGNDPQVATAIGRANVDAKDGNFQWAVQLLEEAVGSYKKHPPTESLLQLGNAFRKAGDGKGGGKAYETYNKALEEDPTFAVACLRLAKIFESQKNWELYTKHLEDALKRDPKFSPAYYELFFYKFTTMKYDEAEGYLNKFIESKLPEKDIIDDSYFASLCWARKDFDCAIAKDENVVAQMGEKTKPKVLKLLADAYYQKADYSNAKKYIDWYFRREKKEDFISFDYKLRADILSKSGAPDEEVFANYVEGVKLDTVLADKIDFLKQGANFFKENKKRSYEAQLTQMIIDLKPNPTINDYFDLTIATYFIPDYFKSKDAALVMIEKFPDQVYGYEWYYNNAVAITTDTTLTDSLKTKYNMEIGAPAALKLFEFSEKDTVKFKSQYVNAVKFLAAYYINVEKDKAKSLDFFGKWKAIDSANADAIQGYIDQISKMPDNPKPTTVPKQPLNKPGSSK